MNTTQLFQIALGLESPWYVDQIKFSKGLLSSHRLDIYLSFQTGSRFKDDIGQECGAYDTIERRWRHLNFFEHTCYLYAKIPRIRTSSGKVKQVNVLWARPNSGFTLLFEAFSMCLLENEMPVNKAAKTLRIYPQRLWTIFNYWIKRAFNKDDQSQVTCLGIDETSSRKGHKYVTIGVDLERRKTLYVCPGKDEKTVEKLKDHLEKKGVSADQISHVSMDMSPAFISGVTKHFPDSAIVFDRFHVVKMLNDAVDQVRKRESKIHKAIRGHKYTFLKNNIKLSKQQLTEKYRLMDDYPALGQVVVMKELFNDFWEFNDQEEASAFLSYWCDLAEEAKILPLMNFVKSIKFHWSGLMNYVQRKISNGVLEGINSKIQLAKRRARGYRNIDNFINMIYFLSQVLNLVYFVLPAV